MSALRKVGIAALTAIAIAGTTVSLPDVAEARGGHGGGGGHWGSGSGGGHWGGGGGWRTVLDSPV